MFILSGTLFLILHDITYILITFTNLFHACSYTRYTFYIGWFFSFKDRSEIEFNTSGSLLNVVKGEETHVKCSADSSPSSNMTWIEESDQGDIIRRQCDLQPECVLDINTDVISKRRFICAIRYLQIHDNKTLSVNIYKPSKLKYIYIISYHAEI